MAKAGFHALHVAVMRRDERMVEALLTHGATPDPKLETWTPTRRSSDDWHFDPAWVGATPFWLAARITEGGIMRLLAKHGANPLFVHDAEWFAEQGFGGVPRTEKSTALLAALNLGGGSPWLQLLAAEREAKTLDAVKAAIELGVDINAESAQGRTALDAAKTLRFASVVDYLTGLGAKAGSAPQPGPGRGGPPR
jgi:ankyrin repeat protein